MRLELRNNGSVVIREVTADAMAYLEYERDLVDATYTRWLFSHNQEGTVYITATPYEDKTHVYEIIEELIAHYGLIVPDILTPVLYTWRRDACIVKNCREKTDAMKERVYALKRVLKNGCEGCENFCYDGDYGRCKADGGVLNETPLSFRNGQYDRDGVWHVGQKFYPHESCKLLNEKEIV